jgi:hypothetical protein
MFSKARNYGSQFSDKNEKYSNPKQRSLKWMNRKIRNIEF